MINKVSLLGDYVINNIGDDNPLGLNTDLKEANVILLKFNLTSGNCKYIGVDSMDYNKSRDLNKLLPKNAPGQVKSDFPTYFIPKKNMPDDFTDSIYYLSQEDVNEYYDPITGFKLDQQLP